MYGLFVVGSILSLRPIKIRIPSHLTSVGLREQWQLPSQGLFLWALPMVFSAYAYGDNLLWNTLACIIGTVFGALGFHLLGVIGHEGTHFNLHPDKFLSARIGIWISSMVPFHLDTGFAISHAAHHRYQNSDRDPDLKVFGEFKTFWSRLLVSRIVASFKYAEDTYLLAFNRWPKDSPIYLSLEPKQLRQLARENLICSYFWGAVYIYLAFEIIFSAINKL